MKKAFVLTYAALLAATPVAAETIAVVGGKVHTLSSQGVIENGTVLIVDGKIAAVGADVPVPNGARTIDAQGQWVTPGIFNPYTYLGAAEGPSGTNSDHSGADNAPFSAAFDVQYAINPYATAIAVTRIEGVTRAAVHPSSSQSIFEGYGALIHLGNANDITFKPRAFASVNLGERGALRVGGTRGDAWVALFAAFEEAQGAGKGSDHDNYLNRLDKEALPSIIEGKTPLFARVERASDILNVIKLKAKYKRLNLVVLGASEGWLVADELAKSGIPVIVDSFANLPQNFETIASTQENAARLEKAGVRVAFAPLSAVGGATGNARLVLQYAGNAVAHGMSWEKALEAITLVPAQIYGVDKQLGSLEAGKTADVVVWNGDPLELSSAPTHVMIAGDEIPLTSRQTELRDRYQELNDSKPFAYRH